MPFSPPDEIGLHYERSGAGEALVLVHGSWVDGRTWEVVRPSLARSFDLRPAHVAGASGGGSSALRFGATHPGLVRTVPAPSRPPGTSRPSKGSRRRVTHG